MRSTVLAMLLALGAGSGLVVGADGQKNQPDAPARVVIPFDFESKFDGGAYGQTLGEMFWKKLERRGGFVIPESMLDVRAWCKQKLFLPGPDTPLERMKAVVRQEQGGDIGIWGKVERVAGADTDVYDLWIVIVDFTAEPPRTVFNRKVRTKAVSEIPHVHVKAALDALYGKGEPVAQAGPNSAAVKARWEKGPNLVRGDFAKGSQGPLGWDPLPQYVTWEREPGAARRFLRFTIPPPVAESTGVLIYSDFFPVQAGATYRLQCRWRSTGTAVKVFVKCYDALRGEFGGKGGTQKREVYRSQQNLSGPPGHWNTHTEDFTPKHAQFTPRWGRVMLYAYYPAGTVDWSEVVVKEIIPPAPRTGG
jgi:hypothetical protein